MWRTSSQTRFGVYEGILQENLSEREEKVLRRLRIRISDKSRRRILRDFPEYAFDVL